MKLHEKLILLRRDKKLTQEEVAYQLKVSRQMISRWESGNEKPTIEKLEALATIYQVHMNELFEQSNYQEKSGKKNNIIKIVTVISVLLALGLCAFFIYRDMNPDTVNNDQKVILEGEYIQEDGHGGVKQYIEIHEDGTFLFNYNMCAGMVDIKGTWIMDDKTLKLLSDDGKEFTFMVANKNTIKYIKPDNQGCGPQPEDYFSK